MRGRESEELEAFASVVASDVVGAHEFEEGVLEGGARVGRVGNEVRGAFARVACEPARQVRAPEGLPDVEVAVEQVVPEVPR